MARPISDLAPRTRLSSCQHRRRIRQLFTFRAKQFSRCAGKSPCSARMPWSAIEEKETAEERSELWNACCGSRAVSLDP